MRSDDRPASHARREGRHGSDGHRRPRFFGNGELRLVMLDILCGGASHGYELIKAIETLTAGHYAPSPGVVYRRSMRWRRRGLSCCMKRKMAARR